MEAGLPAFFTASDQLRQRVALSLEKEVGQDEVGNEDTNKRNDDR